ncbi:MAG TPA: 16S rRNA (cytosine(967)-C(5))-methyltransferase RsmB [Steroidobacteraceae bacterium]
MNAATTAGEVLAESARSLERVVSDGAAADAALAPVLGWPAASAVRAITLGTLRWYFRLEPAVLPLLARRGDSTPGVLRALLIVSAHQLEYSRNRPETTVHAAVEAARRLGLERAAGMVNAVLRRFLREREALLAKVDQDPARRVAHPSWLYQKLAGQWPQDLERIVAANNAHPPMSLRVDTSRVSREAYLDELAAANIAGRAVSWCASAVMLEQPLPVAKLPGFADGRVSVQDAGAQLAAALLAPETDERVLDACAAPGGKTGALLELRDGALELTAADSDAARLTRVAENLKRLRREALLVAADLTAPTKWWDGRAFDAILLDAPCSGTGVIRRHPDIKLLRRNTDLVPMSEVQLLLLRNLWPLLRAGGRLLYVTCSVLGIENEQVVERFLALEPSARAGLLPPAMVPDGLLRPCTNGWQLLPGGEAGADGFYYACLRRQ